MSDRASGASTLPTSVRSWCSREAAMGTSIEGFHKEKSKTLDQTVYILSRRHNAPNASFVEFGEVVLNVRLEVGSGSIDCPTLLLFRLVLRPNDA